MGRRMEQPITTCINTNNNFAYLKLAVESIRNNAYYKNQPIVIYAENCTDGTNKWLRSVQDLLGLTIIIEENEVPKGIGGGMDVCVSKAKTEYVNIIHSDMWIAPNQDIELLKLYDGLDKSERLIASSFRIQPKIFPNDPDYRPGTVFVPMDGFGSFHDDFDKQKFDEWSTEFSRDNDLTVRKGGGAGFFCRTEDYKWIGGNDPLFAPASFDDMDLFIRMQNEGYTFKMISKSVLYHFSARGSHFRDEAKDNFNSKSTRQQKAESDNSRKFYDKWGQMPVSDEATFVTPINNPKVPNRIPLI